MTDFCCFNCIEILHHFALAFRGVLYEVEEKVMLRGGNVFTPACYLSSALTSLD